MKTSGNSFVVNWYEHPRFDIYSPDMDHTSTMKGAAEFLAAMSSGKDIPRYLKFDGRVFEHGVTDVHKHKTVIRYFEQ